MTNKKHAGGGPDSWPTQTACCKEHGGCGYSGGPGGRECWAPNFAEKKCVKHRLDEPNVNCDTGLKGGYQLQRICETEEFAGAAVTNRMAPATMDNKMAVQPAMQDKMAPRPVAPAMQDKMAPPRPAMQDKMAPAMQDKMAPVKPQGGGAQVIEIKYTGRGNTDVGGEVDIPSGGNPYTKVCGGVTRIIVACNQTKGCAAFVLETKDIQNPGACGYLKKAGGKTSARQGWSVFVRS